MDKRGGVLGIGLLPWFALAVCLASLIVFISYDSNFSDQTKEVSSAIKTIDFNQQYIISTAYLSVKEISLVGITKDNFRNAALKHDMHIDGQGNFFFNIDQGNFNLDKNQEGYLLTIPSLFVSADTDTIKIKRSFDLSIQFNDNGEFIRFINK